MTSPLLLTPQAPDGDGTVIDVTPQSAGWKYVGMSIHRLAPGAGISRRTSDREHCVVILTGRAKATAEAHGQTHDFAEVGARMSIFSRDKPYALYVPAGASWRLQATTDLEIAIASAPGDPALPVKLITPDDMTLEARGSGTNTRFVHPIMMNHADRAHKLLVTEVYTPSGNWSSYPPHKHDNDALPDESHLEETYYHRMNPSQGFAFQRVYTDDRSIDETMTVHDGDVVMVPRGYHPVGAPHGYDLYYLNVMAGPKRDWVFRNDPAHEWIVTQSK